MLIVSAQTLFIWNTIHFRLSPFSAWICVRTIRMVPEGLHHYSSMASVPLQVFGPSLSNSLKNGHNNCTVLSAIFDTLRRQLPTGNDCQTLLWC